MRIRKKVRGGMRTVRGQRGGGQIKVYEMSWRPEVPEGLGATEWSSILFCEMFYTPADHVHSLVAKPG